MNIRQLAKISSLAVINFVASLMGKSVQPAILMYHSFDTTGWKHGVDPRELQKQISYLVKRRNIVSLQDIVDFVRGGKEIPNNSVAITIDDGYEDTYSVFFPLAKQHKIPFTLFLTTDLSVMPKLGNLPRPTIAQLKEMFNSGLMSVGVHGHTHTNFTEALKIDTLDNEISKCQEFIISNFGSEPRFVAYPAGRYDLNVVRKIKELQYPAACSTIPGVINRGDDPRLLKRIGVDRATSFLLFKLRLNKGYPFFVSMLRFSRRFRNFLLKLTNMVWKILSGRNPLAVSLPKSTWDSQFERGYWNFLLDAPANVQYIASNITERYAGKTPSILDVGCGNGVIPKLLKGSELTFHYVGTDISEVAVTQAREHFPEGRFFATAMERPPDINETFDVVIFSEVLLYGSASQIIEAHRRFISSDTLVIISLYRNWRTWIIWHQISRLFVFETSQVLTDKEWGSGWKIRAGRLRNR